jgi:hypothetical protein
MNLSINTDNHITNFYELRKIKLRLEFNKS